MPVDPGSGSFAISTSTGLPEPGPASIARPLTPEQSAALVADIETEFDACGFGLWAVEVPGHGGFIGFVGLHRVSFDAPFTPAVEVGWRLERDHWGQGFATEAAQAGS